MPKISPPDKTDTDKRVATRIFWMGVLGAVLGILGVFGLFRAVGLLDGMPPEAATFMMVVSLVAMLLFMLMNRNPDGTIRFTKSETKKVPTSKPPQGRRTILLVASTGALYWLLVNVLHPPEIVLSLAKIVTSAAIAVLCARYALRANKPKVDPD